MYRKRFKSSTFITISKRQLALFLFSSMLLSGALFLIGFLVGKGYFSELKTTEKVGQSVSSMEKDPQEKATIAAAAKQPEKPAEAQSPQGSPADERLTFFDYLPKEKIPDSASPVNLQEAASTRVGQGSGASDAGRAKKELKEPKAQASPRGAFTVQVAAFKEIAVAENLSEQLAKQGYRARVESPGQITEGAWHKVTVGDFTTESEAKIILRKISGEEGLKGFILKR